MISHFFTGSLISLIVPMASIVIMLPVISISFNSAVIAAIPFNQMNDTDIYFIFMD